VRNRPCGAAPVLEKGVSVQGGFETGDAVRGRELALSVANRGSGAATPFLVAVMPAAKGAIGNVSMRIAFQSGPLGESPAEGIVTLTNGQRLNSQGHISGQRQQLSLGRVLAYAQSDGSVKVYVALEAGCSAAVRVDMVQDPEILLVPEPGQTTPTGTLVFDTGNPAQYHLSGDAAQGPSRQ